MSIRFTPEARDVFRRFAPQKVPGPTATEASATPTPVTARLESTQEGVCPYCQKTMRKSHVAIGEVWLCDDDRHVVPPRNA